MLSNERLYQRKWGDYRTIAALLRSKQVSPNGPTSVVVNNFSQFQDLLEIAIICEASKSDLLSPASSEDLRKRFQDLEHLSRNMESSAMQLSAFAREIQNIERELAGQIQKQEQEEWEKRKNERGTI